LRQSLFTSTMPGESAVKAGRGAVSLSQPLLDGLRRIVGADNVVVSPEELLTYETDAYPFEETAPRAVVLPANTDEVSRVVSLLYAAGIPFTPRGAGTSLSGGAVPAGGGVTIGLSRMKKIWEVDLPNRRALVEAGVVNLALSREVLAHGLHFAPDPSSQYASTIGGNIANNSGGPHTLKHGVTANHVTGLEMVLADGRVVWLGGRTGADPGYDLAGLSVSSEGTFGIVTRAWVKLTKNPQAVTTLLGSFRTVRDATETVSEIVGSGIIPVALELMDALIIEAVEEAFHAGLNREAGAVLIVELDGLQPGIARQAERVKAICAEHQAMEVREARHEKERALLWFARKKAGGAVGRLSPSYVTQDVVIPRNKLPQSLERIAEIGRKYSLRIANLCHAGDGNLHPLVMFDDRDEAEIGRVLQACTEIIRLTIEMGGSVTGEHGIGTEKKNFLPLFFTEQDIILMKKVKEVFNPRDLCNPGKIFPKPGMASEMTILRNPAWV